jgi:hypothetical protein
MVPATQPTSLFARYELGRWNEEKIMIRIVVPGFAAAALVLALSLPAPANAEIQASGVTNAKAGMTDVSSARRRYRARRYYAPRYYYQPQPYGYYQQPYYAPRYYRPAFPFGFGW